MFHIPLVGALLERGTSSSDKDDDMTFKLESEGGGGWGAGRWGATVMGIFVGGGLGARVLSVRGSRSVWGFERGRTWLLGGSRRATQRVWVKIEAANPMAREPLLNASENYSESGRD